MKVRLTENTLRKLVENTAKKVLREYMDEPGWLLPDPNEEFDDSWINGELEDEELGLFIFGAPEKSWQHPKNYSEVWDLLVDGIPELAQFDKYTPYLSLYFLMTANIGISEGQACEIQVKDLGLDEEDAVEPNSQARGSAEIVDVCNAIAECLRNNESKALEIVNQWANSRESTFLSDEDSKNEFGAEMAQIISDNNPYYEERWDD